MNKYKEKQILIIKTKPFAYYQYAFKDVSATYACTTHEYISAIHCNRIFINAYYTFVEEENAGYATNSTPTYVADFWLKLHNVDVIESKLGQVLYAS